MTGHYTEATSSHVRFALAKVIINIQKKMANNTNAMILAIKEQQMFMSCAKNIKRMELFKSSSSAVLSYLLLLILKKSSTKENADSKERDCTVG